jgi:hypothetical protein
MGKSQEHIKNFIANVRDTGLNVEAKVGVGAGGFAGAPVPLPAKPSVNVTITAPLVSVEGSADRRTAELAADMMKEQLRSVIVEATSSNAPASMKRIRTQSRVY